MVFLLNFTIITAINTIFQYSFLQKYVINKNMPVLYAVIWSSDVMSSIEILILLNLNAFIFLNNNISTQFRKSNSQ